MDALAPLIVTLIAAYLVGSIPVGLLVTRAFRLGDLRQIGSGNIGATNVLRTGHRLAALLTLILDMAKGAVAAGLPLLLVEGAQSATMLQCGGLAVIGHCYSPWLRLRGGKGVATAFGTLLAVNPLVGLAALALWVGVAAITRKSSLAALVALTLSPALLLIEAPRLPVVLPWLLVVAVIIIRHEANIGRLLQGTEPEIRLFKEPTRWRRKQRDSG